MNSEHELYQQHIAHRAACDGEQHLLFPEVEPNRHGDYAHALRKMVGESTLDELFFSCFAQGLVYVIQSGRYLYPTAISIYNHYAQLR